VWIDTERRATRGPAVIRKRSGNAAQQGEFVDGVRSLGESEERGIRVYARPFSDNDAADEWRAPVEKRGKQAIRQVRAETSSFSVEQVRSPRSPRLAPSSRGMRGVVN
jgi:hypothetical protein